MKVSLYEMALSLEQPPQTLLVSPATLLALTKSMVDLLIEQQIAATLLVKLPPGEIWHKEIRRYQEQVTVTKGETSALGGNFVKSSLLLNSGASSEFTKSLQAHHADNHVVETQKAATIVNSISKTEGSYSLTIPASLTYSQMQREYFIIALSPQFCGLILAHRPQKTHQQSKKISTKKAGQLLAISSFDKPVIDCVLDGIKHTVVHDISKTHSVGVLANNDVSRSGVSLKLYSPNHPQMGADVLENWDSVFNCPSTSNPVLVSQLLIKQIQQQDKIQRQVKKHHSTIKAKEPKSTTQKAPHTLYSKDDFLDKLCQELRTPLAHMKMALSLLSSPQLKPNQRQRYLQVINTECDRQNSLINGLLDLGQIDRVGDKTAPKSVRLSEIVPGVVSTYQPLAEEKGVKLAYKVPHELPSVACLSPWLKQIVINLLHNSIKFTPNGGQVWVRAVVQENYVKMEFRDTGVGIPLNEIPKIFDLFYRVRPTPNEDLGGAGLGLTIVQQLLSRCSGSISVVSKLGEGSIFNVLLPISQVKEQAIESASLQGKRLRANG